MLRVVFTRYVRKKMIKKLKSEEGGDIITVTSQRTSLSSSIDIIDIDQI